MSHKDYKFHYDPQGNLIPATKRVRAPVIEKPRDKPKKRKEYVRNKI